MPQIVIYLYDLKKDPTQKCAIYILSVPTAQAYTHNQQKAEGSNLIDLYFIKYYCIMVPKTFSFQARIVRN